MAPPEPLAEWVARQRWFAAKTRRVVATDVEDRLRLGGAVLRLVRVHLDDGTSDVYAMPEDAGGGDALDGPEYPRALLALVAGTGRVAGERGEVTGVPTLLCPPVVGTPTARRLGGEQSNTSVVLGEQAILKHFRRLLAGPNPDAEISRFLTERAAFTEAPRLIGHVEYRAGGTTHTLAVVHELVRDAVDGWAWILAELERAPRGPADTGPTAAPAALAALERLGDLTARLHRALASGADDPAFAPEPITPADVARWADGVRRQVATARAALGGRRVPQVPDVGDALAALVGATKLRHHGDYHLGQTLYRPRDGRWTILDFEGEPLRPIAERRAKTTPLRDVAGMLRSIDYAVTIATGDGEAGWGREATARFLGAYRRRAADAAFVPTSATAFARAVAAFLVEKAAYEIVYEANHRPDWVGVPLAGLARAAAAVTASPGAGAGAA